MTERFESSQDDPGVSPHQFLLSALGKYLSPENEHVRVVWGERPSLLVGGDAKMIARDDTDTIKKYGVSLACDAWAWQNRGNNPDILYDVHLIGRTAAEVVTRFAVSSSGMYLATPNNPLTTEKLQKPVDEGVVSAWARFLHSVRFSEQSTNGAYDHLSAWAVVEAGGFNDTVYANVPTYDYMERFYQESGGQE